MRVPTHQGQHPDDGVADGSRGQVLRPGQAHVRVHHDQVYEDDDQESLRVERQREAEEEAEHA